MTINDYISKHGLHHLINWPIREGDRVEPLPHGELIRPADPMEDWMRDTFVIRFNEARSHWLSINRTKELARTVSIEKGVKSIGPWIQNAESGEEVF